RSGDRVRGVAAAAGAGPRGSCCVTQVPLRWTDQDAYRHLNHARAVTVLEEARIALFFDRDAEDGLRGFADGLLVAELNVAYRRQVAYRSTPVRITMSVDEL